MTQNKNAETELDRLEVDVAHTSRILEDPNFQIVDCREPNEWRAGHLEPTVLIPLDSLPSRLHDLDKTKPVVVVCRSGRRSLLAAEMLDQQGFADAKSMAGGLIAWVESGRQVVT